MLRPSRAAVAVLVRETSLVLAIALGSVYVWQAMRRKERTIAPIVFLAPAVVYAATQLILAGVWGTAPIAAGTPAGNHMPCQLMKL